MNIHMNDNDQDGHNQTAIMMKREEQTFHRITIMEIGPTTTNSNGCESSSSGDDGVDKHSNNNGEDKDHPTKKEEGSAIRDAKGRKENSSAAASAAVASSSSSLSAAPSALPPHDESFLKTTHDSGNSSSSSSSSPGNEPNSHSRHYQSTTTSSNHSNSNNKKESTNHHEHQLASHSSSHDERRMDSAAITMREAAVLAHQQMLQEKGLLRKSPRHRSKKGKAVAPHHAVNRNSTTSTSIATAASLLSCDEALLREKGVLQMKKTTTPMDNMDSSATSQLAPTTTVAAALRLDQQMLREKGVARKKSTNKDFNNSATSADDDAHSKMIQTILYQQQLLDMSREQDATNRSWSESNNRARSLSDYTSHNNNNNTGISSTSYQSATAALEYQRHLLQSCQQPLENKGVLVRRSSTPSNTSHCNRPGATAICAAVSHEQGLKEKGVVTRRSTTARSDEKKRRVSLPHFETRLQHKGVIRKVEGQQGSQNGSTPMSPSVSSSTAVASSMHCEADLQEKGVLRKASRSGPTGSSPSQGSHYSEPSLSFSCSSSAVTRLVSNTHPESAAAPAAAAATEIALPALMHETIVPVSPGNIMMPEQVVEYDIENSLFHPNVDEQHVGEAETTDGCHSASTSSTAECIVSLDLPDNNNNNNNNKDNDDNGCQNNPNNFRIWRHAKDFCHAELAVVVAVTIILALLVAGSIYFLK